MWDCSFKNTIKNTEILSPTTIVDKNIINKYLKVIQKHVDFKLY
jgi:hypothetical protein